CGVFWTLLIEVKFYALAPLLMGRGRQTLRVAPYLLLAINAAIFVLRGETSNLLTYLTFCVIGMQFGPWTRREVSDMALAVPIVLAAASYGALGSHENIGVAILVIIDAAIMMFALRRPFTPPALPFVGIISYSWYLYHAAVG